MAPLNAGDTHSRFAVIYADSERVPISSLLENDGLALVTSLRLILKFWLSEDFMYIDEEVFDLISRDLRHPIIQSPVCNGDSKHWYMI
jgi:hypothetical protein